MAVKVAAIKESAPGERRVALVPEAVARLAALGVEMLVETGAGDGGVVLRRGVRRRPAPPCSTRDAVRKEADVIVTLTRPDDADVALLRPGPGADRPAPPADRPGARRRAGRRPA